MKSPVLRALAALLFAMPLLAQDLEIGVPYERRATREETLELMLERLSPEKGRWGEWYLLSPFPYAGHQAHDLLTRLAPEAELDRMVANAPGPDLARTYAGKKGVEARWEPLGKIANQRVDLHTFDDPDLRDMAVCYLYTTVESERARSVELSMGSDDGLRFWLNGELVHTADVPRGMVPDDDHVRLHLEEGTNHVLVKVSEGAGSWEFQINTREPLSAREDAWLYYLLDRDFPPSRERAHYSVLTYSPPEDAVLEVGGIAFLSDGSPVVTTRRGDVWVVEDAFGLPPWTAKFRLFASGLHEPLGCAVRQDADGEAVYAVQRGELTRLRDADGDGVAEQYETFCDDWGVSGNYHEFAFGPKFDAEGNAWVTLNVGFCGSLGKSLVKWRGWALKVTPEGVAIPICDGLRSPNGIGAWKDGTMFYVDNQGDYVGTNRLSVLQPGAWHGHPASLRWREDLASPDARPPRTPATVWFPYYKMGQSAADLALDATGGSFGPFRDQFFTGDQTLACVMRADLEQVDGLWQGACFPFLEDLSCGVNRLAFAPDGSLLVGETDRGWASVGRKRHGLERVVFTGLTPFELLHMRAKEDGFELTFTLDVDPATAADPASYSMSSYTYEYHADYGAPEDDTLELEVVSAELVDARTVRLRIDPLREGYVHELHAAGVRSKGDAERPSEPLLHDDAYYTLQHVPGREHQQAAAGRRLPRVLFLTHSAGFEHGVVQREDPEEPSLAERALVAAAAGRFEVLATQDCQALEPELLASYDAVAFYTTGELPVPPEWRDALLAWIEGGGAFVGVHCATDTFYDYPPYQRMLGGVFDGHPWNQEVPVAVVDGDHPATRHLGGGFRIADEIYQFRDYRGDEHDVLLRLDTDAFDASAGKRADGDYALAWCREFGEGRVFYTALGHRPELWSDTRFLEHLLGGIAWAMRRSTDG